MQEHDFEKLVDEMIRSVKNASDVSAWKKNRQVSPLLTVISQLHSMPRTVVSSFNFNRVKNQILDRISVPQAETASSNWLVASLPNMLRIGVMALGSLLIIVSLTLGFAVTALNSQPGSPLYSMKRVVENAQLTLAPEDQKANLQLQFANARLDELTQVIQQQQEGQISAATAQKIVAATVTDLQKTTAAAAQATATQPKAAIVTKLADISNKLQIASIRTEGEVKIEIEKAIETTQDQQAQAIQNLAQAGVQVGNNTVLADNTVAASGKLTAVADTYISIGTAKFLLTKNTQYVNLTNKDLAIDEVVTITGEIKDNKTYADQITLVTDTKTSSDKSTNASNPAPNPTPTPAASQ